MAQLAGKIARAKNQRLSQGTTNYGALSGDSAKPHRRTLAGWEDRRRRTVLDARVVCLNKMRLKGAGIYRFGAHIGLNRRHQHASKRASTRGWDLLLSSLRSNVFGDPFAASQEGQQYCEMRDLQANDGRAGQGSSLQAHSSA